MVSIRPRIRLVGLSLVLAVVFSACGGSDEPDQTPVPRSRPAAGPAPQWPAPTDPLERIRAAGLEPERRELLQTHRHSHLDVFFNGAEVTVPAGIGINVADPGVRHADTPDGPSYGGIRECVNPCISPLHTHDESGTLHTEAAGDELRTLGQFFVEWGVRLDAGCVGEFCRPATAVAVYVDGESFTGDPADIPLRDRAEIAVVIGSPPPRIPDSFDSSSA